MNVLVIAFVVSLVIGAAGALFLSANRQRAEVRAERKWARVSQELEGISDDT